MEENQIIDVQSQEVVDEPAPEAPTMSYKERKQLEEARVRTLNKLLKNYRRRMKNPMTIVKNLDNK